MRTLSTLFSVVVLSACSVEAPNLPSGGVDFDDASKSSACERGVAVVTSDYRSTNVAITTTEGSTLSESFVSSGSVKPGLTMALSGDVIVPRAAPASGRLVLLDRFGTNVITWMDLERGEVLNQLAVGTGFESNPQDYLEFDANLALVSRYGTNPNRGRQSFDGGDDLIVIATDEPEILERIEMPEEDPNLLPRPSAMTRLGEDSVAVTLGRLSEDFTVAGEGRFVGVSLSRREVTWTVDLGGLTNCGRLVRSPSGRVGAIACSSQIDTTTYRYDSAKSDIVLFDLTLTPPVEIRRLGLGRALDCGLQPTLDFAAETRLLAQCFGGNSSPGDRLLTVDAETGAYEVLHEAEQAFVYGSIHCAPGCGDVCLVADAEIARLRRFGITASGEVAALTDVTVDSLVGLPPRGIGGL